MIHLIFSSVLLSIIHALIPNHWLPLVAIGKAEKWSHNKTLLSTVLAGFAHIASTILIGILVGWAGYSLSSSFYWISSIAAPAILVAIGLFYVALFFFHRAHVHDHFKNVTADKTSYAAIIISLCVSMFFSPCIELESYYFTAGTFGWAGIIAVSVAYLIVTVSAMVVLVALALKGIENMNFTWLEKNEKLIIGFVLIALGLFTFFIKL